MTIAPMTVGTAIAIAVMFVAVLLMLGIVPFTPLTIGLLFFLCAVARLT